MAPLRLFVHTFGLRFHFRYEPGFDIFAFIARAAEDGFAGVNIGAKPPDYEHLGGLAPAYLARVRAALAEANLGCDLDTAGTAPAHLASMLEVARALGASHLRVYTHHGGPPGEAAERTARDLTIAARDAEAAGVRLLLENHEDFTGPEVAAILARVASPSVGALYDYGNGMMLMEPPLAGLAAMAPYARSAHLKDHVMLAPADVSEGRPAVLGVPMGAGNVPIVEITRRLVAAGVERVAFENVWAYRAPVIDGRGGARAGEGAFAFAAPPFDEAVCMLDAQGLAARAPARLVALERAAFDTGLAWLREAFAAAGIALARPSG